MYFLSLNEDKTNRGTQNPVIGATESTELSFWQSPVVVHTARV